MPQSKRFNGEPRVAVPAHALSLRKRSPAGPLVRLILATLLLASWPTGLQGDQPPGERLASDGQAGQPSVAAPYDSADSTEPDFRTEVIRGKVSWLAEILERSFGISTVPEVSQQALAILSKDGHVYPLVENIRGRAFRKDQRLRDRELEIWVRRHDRQPLVQVLRIIEHREEGRFELDYWCDVCAIPMYETGPCDCCQDHNRLRERPVDR